MKGRRRMKLPGGAGTARSPPKPGASESMGRNEGEPTCSPVTQSGRPSPSRTGEGSTRREVDDTSSDGLLRGIKDGTRTKGTR